MELGTGKYSAFVVARPLLPGGGRSTLSIDMGPRLSVEWGRVRNRTSEGTVTLPIDGCDERLWNVLRATIACELHIYRHVRDRRKRVWRGPITRASRTPSRIRSDDGSKGKISVAASDASWWLQSRYPPALTATDWDPAELAAWLYREGREQDPWDDEVVIVHETAKRFEPDWTDLPDRPISEWMSQLDDRVTWRIVDGVYEVGGLGRYQRAYVGIGGQDLRLRVDKKVWRDDPSELVDAANVITLVRATRTVDRVFGGKVQSSYGTEFTDSVGNVQASGRYDADGVDPLFGLLELRITTDEADERAVAYNRWQERNRPEILVSPDADLDACSPYDLDLWLPGVEVVFEDDGASQLYRLDEVQVTGQGLGGDDSGSTATDDPRDAEGVRVLLSSVPDVDNGDIYG